MRLLSSLPTIGTILLAAAVSQPAKAEELGRIVDKAADSISGSISYTVFLGDNAIRSYFERSSVRDRVVEAEKKRRTIVVDEYKRVHPQLASMPNMRSQNVEEVYVLNRINIEDTGIVALLNNLTPEDAQVIARYAKEFQEHYNAWESKKYVIFSRLANETIAYVNSVEIRPSLVPEQRIWDIAKGAVPLKEWDEMYQHEDGMYTALAGSVETIANGSVVPVMPRDMLVLADPSGLLGKVTTYNDALNVLGVYKDLAGSERRNIELLYSTKTAAR